LLIDFLLFDFERTFPFASMYLALFNVVLKMCCINQIFYGDDVPNKIARHDVYAILVSHLLWEQNMKKAYRHSSGRICGGAGGQVGEQGLGAVGISGNCYFFGFFWL
jgi:hypothetical protein